MFAIQTLWLRDTLLHKIPEMSRNNLRTNLLLSNLDEPVMWSVVLLWYSTCTTHHVLCLRHVHYARIKVNHSRWESSPKKFESQSKVEECRTFRFLRNRTRDSRQLMSLYTGTAHTIRMLYWNSCRPLLMICGFKRKLLLTEHNVVCLLGVCFLYEWVKWPEVLKKPRRDAEGADILEKLLCYMFDFYMVRCDLLYSKIKFVLWWSWVMYSCKIVFHFRSLQFIQSLHYISLISTWLPITWFCIQLVDCVAGNRCCAYNFPNVEGIKFCNTCRKDTLQYHKSVNFAPFL